MGARYLSRRLLSAVATILMIVLLNFVLFRMMPGSPERMLLGRLPGVTQEVLQGTRERWGLDKPLFPDQFVAYVGATLQGDLGFSYTEIGSTVADVLLDRLGPTLLLFGLGEILAIVIGLVLGAYSGWKRGGFIDHVGNAISLFLYSTPYFLLGMGLLVTFATALGRFPTFGMVTTGRSYTDIVDQLGDVVWHLTLPLATVSLGLVGQYAILMRSSILDTLTEDYISTARAKGLTEGRILRGHALPNALLPTVSL